MTYILLNNNKHYYDDTTILVGILAVLGGIILGYFTRQSIAKRQEGQLRISS